MNTKNIAELVVNSLGCNTKQLAVEYATSLLHRLIDCGEVSVSSLTHPSHLHHGFGTVIRNDLGLWTEESAQLRADIWANMAEQKRAFLREFYGNNPALHADEASAEIVDAALAAVKLQRDM